MAGIKGTCHPAWLNNHICEYVSNNLPFGYKPKYVGEFSSTRRNMWEYSCQDIYFRTPRGGDETCLLTAKRKGRGLAPQHCKNQVKPTTGRKHTQKKLLHPLPILQSWQDKSSRSWHFRVNSGLTRPLLDEDLLRGERVFLRDALPPQLVSSNKY